MPLAQDHYQIRELLQDRGVVFCYSGYITATILLGIGQAIKQKLALDDVGTNIINGVFSVFVEQMQNMIRYSAEREANANPDGSDLSYGTLTVGRDGDGFFVTCGNKIERQHVEKLKNKLTAIQQMDRGGLKAFYKKTLRGETPEGSKGAGVGFVDIAKNASRPIEFDFAPMDDKYDFFTLRAII